VAFITRPTSALKAFSSRAVILHEPGWRRTARPRLDRAAVRDLLQPALFDDGVGFAFAVGHPEDILA
jgi:hypothetical protein